MYPQTENRQANKWQAYERHLFALFALSESTAVCITLLLRRLPPPLSHPPPFPNEFKSHAFHWNEHFTRLFVTQFMDYCVPSNM